MPTKSRGVRSNDFVAVTRKGHRVNIPISPQKRFQMALHLKNIISSVGGGGEEEEGGAEGGG